MDIDKAELEHALEETAGVHATIEVMQEQVVVSGLVRTTEEQQAAMEIMRELAPGMDVVDNLVIEDVLPEEIGDSRFSAVEAQGLQGAQPGTSDDESLEPGDFTDQETLRDPSAASGPSGTHPDDELDDGDRNYVPPTDPVRDREGEFLGGFQQTALDDNEAPHSEILPGAPDEAIVEAVLSELHQDAATTALEIQVTSEDGVIYLDGTVADLDDAENAQAVASRVAGDVEIRDRLKIAAG